MRLFIATTAALALALPAEGQWLQHPTLGIARDAGGKPDLTAPTPRTLDGTVDFTGVWTGAERSLRPASVDVQPWAKQVAQDRAQDFFKARPMYQCLPSGPDTFAQSTGGGVWKRIVQTSSLIAILNDDLTYRTVFMDGRTLEADPIPSWMGYSVGRWEGDTLVVDSTGFNDRTWLNDRGLPHTDALHMTERYQRLDFGHLQVDVTFVDPSTLTRPVSFTASMALAADTEMLERVCETSSDGWVGKASNPRTGVVNVAPDVLARYVGVYSGIWAARPRTVQVALRGEQLVATVNDEPEPITLVGLSETLFESSEGLAYEFVPDRNGGAIAVMEMRVSGDY